MGFIDGVKGIIDWASPKIKSFIGGASDFVNTTPKYIDDSTKTLSKNFDELYKKNPVSILEEYAPDVLVDVDGKKTLPKNFSRRKLHSTGAREAYIKNTRDSIRRTNAFNALDYENFDPGSQVGLNKVYQTINQEGFKDLYFQHQLELGKKGRGMFADNYKNFFAKGTELNDKQLETLGKYFNEKYYFDDAGIDGGVLSRFQTKYTQTGGSPEIGPNQRLNYNVGLQKKYLTTANGQRQLGLIDSSNKKGKSIIDLAIEKNANDATTLNAYRDHLNKQLLESPDINGTWEAPQSFKDWAINEGTMNDEEIKRLSKELAAGDPDHSGIGIWQMAKNHPVIATSVVLGGVFGISELTEEDSL